MERYEIAIIGTGPAGLEAAITAKIRNKKILLIGNSDLSIKVSKAHEVKNYLGLPAISGEELKNSFKAHLDQMDIPITNDRVNTVYAMGDYFAIQGHNDMYEAESVILACGLSTVNPIPGEMENLGMGISYCATCDGVLYKGKKAIVIGYAKEEEKEATFLAELLDEVIYIPMYELEGQLDSRIKVLTDVKPTGIKRVGGQMELATLDETIYADVIFVLRQSVPPSYMVPGLIIEKNHVVVDRSLRTNMEGLFACGDITGAPYQYIKAAGEGNVAALEAAKYLDEK